MKKDLLAGMRNGETLSRRNQIELVLRLSIPAILAQISTILMEYIDASMVGHLGSSASAAIGIVSTTTWLVGGLCHAIGTGFTVSIAHTIGAGKDEEARQHVRAGLLTGLAFSTVLALICALIHTQFPYWMGAEEAVAGDASKYFLIFGMTLPLMQINYTGFGMLECSGNMRLPSIMNVVMCFLDVIFNALLINTETNISLFGGRLLLHLPGAGLGVTGAALGTFFSELTGAVFVLFALLVFSQKLHLRRGEKKQLSFHNWCVAVRMSLPVMTSSLVMGSAYVLSTKIVSPLGTIAIAANSFAITAESFCYMPGYGISHAATTLVGQAKGAKRPPLMKQFSYLCVAMGILLMALSGVLLYIYAPEMIGILTPDERIRSLGTAILRIEAFAEPMFGASIVIEGVFRGLGKTMRPTILNLISMWCIRLPLSAFAAARFGLVGVWVVMCAELIFRGTIFLVSMILEFRAKTEASPASVSENH